MRHPSKFLTVLESISTVHRHHLAGWKLVRLAYLPLYCPAVISARPGHPSPAIVLTAATARLFVGGQPSCPKQRQKARLRDVSGPETAVSRFKAKRRERPPRSLLRPMHLETAADGPARL